MKGLIQQDGNAYIAVELMLHVIDLMIAARDEVIEESEERARLLIPGSDAAAAFLTNFLNDARWQFFAKENIGEEYDDMMKGIQKLLNEQ